MKICKHDWEYIGTIDKALPYGEVESLPVYKCRICGEEYVQQIDNDKRA
jgi:hypothetical protein